MPQIKKGEDKTITINVESSSVAFDLTGYNIVVLVYSNEIGIIGRFSRVSSFVDSENNTYDPITIDDESGGIISVLLTSDMTRVANEGALYAVVKLRHQSTDIYVEADPVKVGVIVKTPASNVVDF